MQGQSDNLKSDVSAKSAFVAELRRRGIYARVTASPADITASVNGVTQYYEVKYTRRSDSYFGAATLTEWEAAIRFEDSYWFVVAFERDGSWVFHEYTPSEFMAFSSIPPFKIFFQIPVGTSKASAPSRSGRSVRLTRDRLSSLASLFSDFKRIGNESGAPTHWGPTQSPVPSATGARTSVGDKPPVARKVAELESQVTVRSQGVVSTFILGSTRGEGTISYRSPLGRQLLGRSQGDVVTVQAPGGLAVYEILDVA
jgi:hypothetical protein